MESRYDELVCPRCKTTNYRNPSLKLLVNVCGHALCESCVDLLFLKGSGSCPDCGIALRRNNFRIQLFEDSSVEKEVDIRKRVLRDFNKKEEDFVSLREYNDYLEFVEMIIYNLMNNIDIIETNKKIEQYKKENKEAILKNKVRLGREEEELEELIREEEVLELQRKKEIAELEKEGERQKIRAKEALIDELMFSAGDAKQIVKSFAEQTAQKTAPIPKLAQFSSGVKFASRRQNQPIPKVEEGEPFEWRPLEVDTAGPKPPSPRILQPQGYLAHVKCESEMERAGGFRSNIACLRALQEAFSGLFGS